MTGSPPGTPDAATVTRTDEGDLMSSPVDVASAPTDTPAGDPAPQADPTPGSEASDPSGPADRTGPPELEQAAAEIRRLLDEVSQRAQEFEGQFRERVADAERTFKQEVSQAESAIRENPLFSVAAAAGLGVLVGLLLNRR